MTNLFVIARTAGQFEWSLSVLGILSYLGGQEEPVPVHHLAVELGCSASNVTGLVDRLVRLGMVARAGDPADRRQVLCSLTSAGRDRLQQFMQEVTA